ncbi:probable 3',5'-cyclic phosphodiesterase pde-5 isoform X3 [Ptychodera flava]|uniref:probable 3',5'-cyclic phosphodiesterase pde-5 isoform X3 n=1 Tax=Ptychodera flava TaxID=63121 RepID=UPI003969C28A
MSSPARQVGNRRLPPLPLNKRGASPLSKPLRSQAATYVGTSSRFTSVHPDHMIVTGQSTSFSNGSSRTHVSARGSQLSTESADLLSDHIYPEQVKVFLNENPAFLEEYVLNNVNQEELERWLIRRAQRGTESYKVNRTNSPPRRLSRWKFCVHKDKRKMLQELTKDIHQRPNKAQVLNELTDCISSAVNADGSHLYLLAENASELYLFKPSNLIDNSARWKVDKGLTIAGFVAHSLQTVCTSEKDVNLEKDSRYPDGMAVKVPDVHTVLALPIMQSNGECIGVMEMYKFHGNSVFGEEDEEIASSYLVWGGIGLYYAEMYQNMQKQRKLNEFLLAVTKSIFQDIVSMDTVIMKIMNYAQKLVNADRASLFLCDTKTRELYARIFDVGNGEGPQPANKTQKEIRFPMEKGIAGHVASTGETLNIPDAYLDDRFNRDVDVQTGYVTKTILCMPIYIRGNIIGVMQMVNKKNGKFTRSDEESFETFAIYCGLALHHAKLYDKIRRSEQKYKVALEVLSYHSQCTDNEYDELRNKPLPQSTPELARYEFSPWHLEEEAKPLYVLCMFRDLFGLTRFDYDELCRFTLSVRKNYRKVPYHNWTHAFSVAHAIYTVVKSSPGIFSDLECLALFVACLCHDLDHRGKNNAFMINNATPLASVYSTSTMEHHHFNQTVTILQHDGHNIFRNFTAEEYKQVIGDIKHAILATDLALFFGNKDRLKTIVDEGKYSWQDAEHRYLIKAISMTAADLCATSKPFDISQLVVNNIFEEFWQQGDEEKAQGRQPIPMMDRTRAHELPANQVGFIVGICMPCYELLYRVLPGSKPMMDGTAKNLQNWSALVAKQKADEEDKKEREGREANEKKKKSSDGARIGSKTSKTKITEKAPSKDVDGTISSDLLESDDENT